MKYTENEFIRMNQKEFCDIFTNKHVIVTQKNGSKIRGRITEIGLATNINSDTQDHLPVKIKINTEQINLFEINLIELS